MQNGNIQVIESRSALAHLPEGNVFIPTMGALHDGHAALIRHGARVADGRPIVVSIFVNPTQFNDPADFARYPKTLQNDLDICRHAGATHVFVPPVELMYPRGMDIARAEAATIGLPPVASHPRLEDAMRPGHFAGVYQVVWRLFEFVRPSEAIFGEKDWQQLQVIRAMTERMNTKFGLTIKTTASPTIRESDGLAMSSRNRFLSAQERSIAPVIHISMTEARKFREVADAEAHMRNRLTGAGLSVDYAVIRDAGTLLPLSPGADRIHSRILIAARLGSVRLIDNAAWE